MVFDKQKCFLSTLFLVGIASLHAHEGHHHALQRSHVEKTRGSADYTRALAQLNETYERDIKTIFGAKCVACHASNAPLPWYSNAPGAKALMKKDIAEARRHLDMSEGFPFGGHGTVHEDFAELIRCVQKGSMPPSRYLLMHPETALTEPEKTKILSWAQAGQALLVNH